MKTKRQSYLIREYTKRLRESKGTFESIFNDQFSQEENVLFEFQEQGKRSSVTFGEVKRKIDALASYLVLAFNGRRDMYVALNLDNSVEWAVGFYAILKSGNKPYLVNLRHPKELTSSILATLKVEYSLDLGESNPFGLTSVRIDGHMDGPLQEEPFRWANEIALSTSATTLHEKIALYTGAEILEQLRNTEQVLKKTRLVRKRYGGTIKVLAFLPFYHIFGLITTFFWFTYFGYEIVLLKDYAPKTILHTVRYFKVTHIFAVPLFWHEIEKNVLVTVKKRGQSSKFENACNLSLKLPSFLSQQFAKRAFKEVRSALFGESVRFCIVGGSYVRPSALRLLNAIGYPLFNGYGTTEIGITSCDFSASIKDRIKGSVGKPFASVIYRIEKGCLNVSGLSTCYATIVNGKKELTHHAFETLDLAEVDEKGLYYIKGRQSDLIVSHNGENLSPDDLEAHFDLSKFNVTRFTVLGLGENKDIPALIVELRRDIAKEEAEALKSSLYAQNETLPLSSQIEAFYLTYDPLQSKGAIKISRAYVYRHIEHKDIRLLTFDTLFSSKGEISGDIESTIRGIFSKNLGIEEDRIGMKSHVVLDLGGSSLAYYSILADINERFHVELAYDEEHPLYTVEDFSNAVKEALRK